MTRAIDYYFAVQSPWTYLGHVRLQRIAADAGAPIRVRPIDLGRIFPRTGGLPLGQRAPARQAYRLQELARWARHTGVPLNPQPRFFPVPGDDASRLVIAVEQALGSDAAMQLAGAVFAALWVQQRDIADAATLAALLAECALPATCLAEAPSSAVQATYDDYTQQALDAGVFGAPSYVVDGALFWGQDRLDFVERALRA